MFVVAIVLFAAVIGRVALLQTTQARSLEAAGRAQRTTESVLPAGRGMFLDRDGNPLVLSVPASTLFANPKLVRDPAATVATLATMLQLTPGKQQSLLASFTSREKSFVYIVRQIDDDLARSVMALKLPGIELRREDKRILPSGEVGRSVLGQTDIDRVGISGLELQYNDLLTGVDGERTREHDREGRSIPGSDATTVEPVPGDDLVLTLNRSLQYQVEQALLGQVTKLSAKGGVAIVMDTATGEIYAIANVRRDTDGVVHVTSANMAAVEAYEPGSLAKVFSVSGAIDSGTVTPDSSFMVPYRVIFNRGTKYEQQVEDAEQHPTEAMSVRDIVVRSSNIGTLTVAERLGSQRLGAYLDAFGFGHTSGLGTPNESAGIIKPWDQWQGAEKATVSYGYGYSATSLQLVAGVNAVANGGVYVAPKLLKSTIGADGSLTDAPASSTHRVISEGAAATMTSMMVDVVCKKSGTGHLAVIPGITVAGKTGTGYKLQANGTYIGDNGERAYFASFAGYFPAAQPKITVLVSIDEPDPSTRDRFGGTAAAPVFVDIAQAAIHELQITPTPGDTGCVAAR